MMKKSNKMKFRRKFVAVSLCLASLQSISLSSPAPASAATSYLLSSTYYAYESFSSSGTWTKPYGVSSVDYLVVAGGAGGGRPGAPDRRQAAQVDLIAVVAVVVCALEQSLCHKAHTQSR